MTLNGNEINLPKSIMIKFQDKFKIRHIIEGELFLLHIMLKQDSTWFTLTSINGNEINLPKSIMIKFQDKFKIRHIIEGEPFLLHIMLKQDSTWFTLTSNNPPETVVSQPRYSSRNGL